MTENQYTQSTDVLPSVSELAGLFAQVHWARHRKQADIQRLLANTRVFVTVRQGQDLVGFGRALSDGVCRALLDDIIVDQAHRGRGIGHTIVKSLMSQLSGIEEVYLNTDPPLESFYKDFGFQAYAGLTMKVSASKDQDGQSCRSSQ